MKLLFSHVRVDYQYYKADQFIHPAYFSNYLVKDSQIKKMLCCQQSPIMASFLALNDFEYFCPVLMYDKKAIEK